MAPPEGYWEICQFEAIRENKHGFPSSSLAPSGEQIFLPELSFLKWYEQ